MMDVLSEPMELQEQDELFNAYFDGELSDEERAAFEGRLKDDPALAEEYQHFSEFMGGLHGLSYHYAPDDFVDKVQSKIRTRSRGRFFAEEYLARPRMQFEVVAIVMLIVMATTYLFFGAPADKNIQDLTVQAEPPVLKASPSQSTE